MKTLAFILFMLVPAFAVPVADTFPDPAMETRARALQRQLRCLVCQGESIDESRSPLAADLRHLVREQLAAGKSDQQIEDYLVARYGDFILMKRRSSPIPGCCGWRPFWCWARAVRWPGWWSKRLLPEALRKITPL